MTTLITTRTSRHNGGTNNHLGGGGGNKGAAAAWNSAAAGYAAGVTGTIVGHPFDSAKVWLQTSSPASSGGAGVPTTTRGAAAAAKATTNPGAAAASQITTPGKAPSSTAGATATPSASTIPTSTAAAPSSTTTTTTTTTPRSAASSGAQRMSTLAYNPASMQQQQQQHFILQQSHHRQHQGKLTSSELISRLFRTRWWWWGGNTAARTSSVPQTLRALPSPQQVARTVRSLYAGVSSPLLTVGLVQSINFGVYDSVRRYLYDNGGNRRSGNPEDYRNHDPLVNVAAGSVSAGVVISFIASPMLVIKTKQQLHGKKKLSSSPSPGGDTAKRMSFRRALREILYSTNKATPPQITTTAATTATPRPQWKNLFVGFAPHLLSETVGRAVYFVTYELLKRRFLVAEQEQGERRQHLSPGTTNKEYVPLKARMACAVVSGIVCWVFIFPFDAVKCRLYAQQVETTAPGNRRQGHRPLSTWQMVQKMYLQEGGVRAFYRGFSVTVLRAGPVAAAVLPIYDMTLEYLSSS